MITFNDITPIFLDGRKFEILNQDMKSVATVTISGTALKKLGLDICKVRALKEYYLGQSIMKNDIQIIS